jgi:hypothetical protein
MPPGTGNELDEYRLDINGLRAVAVLAVMVNHFSRPMLPSGNLGVDLFFVILAMLLQPRLAAINQLVSSSFSLIFMQSEPSGYCLPWWHASFLRQFLFVFSIPGPRLI